MAVCVMWVVFVWLCLSARQKGIRGKREKERGRRRYSGGRKGRIGNPDRGGEEEEEGEGAEIGST